MIREEVSKLLTLFFLALHLAYAIYLRDIAEVHYTMFDVLPLIFLLLLERPPKPPPDPYRKFIFWSIFFATIFSFLDLLIYSFWITIYYYLPIIRIGLKWLVAVFLTVASAVQVKVLTAIKVTGSG